MSVELTPYEQYFLELVNRARLNPEEEASRYDVDLNEGLTGEEQISPEPKQPLASNETLLESARSHSQWMLENNEFSHEGVNGSTAIERAESAGYPSSFVGENIAWKGSNQEIQNMDQIIGLIDDLHKGLLTSANHRTNLLKDEYQEVGVGLYTGQFTRNGTDWNAVIANHNYGTNFDQDDLFITGVVYDDLNNNELYDPGEGLPEITVDVSSPDNDFTATTTTMSAGGYQVEVPPGEYEVQFTGDQLETAVTETVTVDDQNLKIDVMVNSSESQILADKITLNLDPLDFRTAQQVESGTYISSSDVTNLYQEHEPTSLGLGMVSATVLFMVIFFLGHFFQTSPQHKKQ